MKPILKWVGGKTQIIDKLLVEYPQKMVNYHDIFVGGGSSLLALLDRVRAGKIIVANKVRAYDINRELIHTYINIQQHPREVWEALDALAREYLACPVDAANIGELTAHIDAGNRNETSTRESYYYWTRANFNKLTPAAKIEPRASAQFIFLNKTCFRGVYRVGPNGFNVPFGHYKMLKIATFDEFHAFSEYIACVEFECLDFGASLSLLRPGDFAYLDPPYAPETSTSFVKYSGDGFNAQQHERLFAFCAKLTQEKISFLMSNSNVDIVLRSFPKETYKIIVIECRRAIHSKNPAKTTQEVLIKNF